LNHHCPPFNMHVSSCESTEGPNALLRRLRCASGESTEEAQRSRCTSDVNVVTPGQSVCGLSTLPSTPPSSSALHPRSLSIPTTLSSPGSPAPGVPFPPDRAGPCLRWLRELPLHPDLTRGLAPGEAVAQFHDASPGGGAVRFCKSEPAEIGELICSVDGIELGRFSEAHFSRTEGVPILTLPQLDRTFLLPPGRHYLENCLLELTGALEQYGVQYSSSPQLPTRTPEVSCSLCSVQ